MKVMVSFINDGTTIIKRWMPGFLFFLRYLECQTGFLIEYMSDLQKWFFRNIQVLLQKINDPRTIQTVKLDVITSIDDAQITLESMAAKRNFCKMGCYIS